MAGRPDRPGPGDGAVARAAAGSRTPCRLGLVALLPFGELGGTLLTAVVWRYMGLLLLDRT